ETPSGISVNDVVVSEAGGSSQFTVTLSPATASAVTVDYVRSEERRVGRACRTPARAHDSLKDNAGERVQEIPFMILDDALYEGDETCSVTLSIAVGASSPAISCSEFVAVITDDETPSGISVNDVVVSEAAGSSQFTVTLAPATGSAVTVDYV